MPITSYDPNSHLFEKKNYQFNIISFKIKYLIDLLMIKRSKNLIKLIQMTESQWSIGLYEIYTHSQLHEKYVYNRPTYIDMWIKMIELNEDLMFIELCISLKINRTK